MSERDPEAVDPRAPARPGETVRLSRRVTRTTQDNPGMFTGPGTNSHLVGIESLFVLDPGEDDDEHFAALLAAIADRPVAAILPSHGHADHWPMAARLSASVRAPVWAFGSPTAYRIDRSLEDGERISVDDATLIVLHTPGHARDHLCFLLEEERALFSGDLVMAWSTSIIQPPDGDLRQYLASLDRLLELDLELDLERLYPAHGDSILEARDRIEELRDHRHQRTRQALEALARGAKTPAEMVSQIYADVDPRLHVAARMSLWAHLDVLVEEGRVVRSPGDPLEATYRLTDGDAV